MITRIGYFLRKCDFGKCKKRRIGRLVKKPSLGGNERRWVIAARIKRKGERARDEGQIHVYFVKEPDELSCCESAEDIQ